MKTLSDFADELDRMQKGIESIPGKVSLDEILTNDFMQSHTKFHSFDELLQAGGFGTTTEEFEAVPDDVFDAYISENTDFKSWQEMHDSAFEKYLSSKLGL